MPEEHVEEIDNKFLCFVCNKSPRVESSLFCSPSCEKNYIALNKTSDIGYRFTKDIIKCIYCEQSCYRNCSVDNICRNCRYRIDERERTMELIERFESVAESDGNDTPKLNLSGIYVLDEYAKNCTICYIDKAGGKFYCRESCVVDMCKECFDNTKKLVGKCPLCRK